MIVLGDSIMWGQTGSGSNHPRANPTIPQAIGNQLGWEVDNEAIRGTKYADNRDGQDFIPQVNKFNFKNYDVVLLGYGINDFDNQPYASTTQVQDAMTKGIAKIRSDNPTIHIYVELPTPSYVYGADDGAVNGAGISQRTMYDAIKQCAKDNHCPAYDWRDNPLITYANRNQTLGDGQIHPAQAVQTQMAQRLATWIAEEEKQQQQPITPNKPVTPANPGKPAIANAADYLSQVKACIEKLGGSFDYTLPAELNRAMYHLLKDATKALQSAINLAIQKTNIDYPFSGINVPTLWMPSQLSINADFIDKLNKNIDAVNEAIAEMQNAALFYRKMMII
ncbi:SGNH/GDSL hydrolase family protein [Limosilactobacillus mucosae]|uniref:SGNH/GDSL hydrolase family protein n=1 Tax=Limosilactobacillus mucosae TaxID=97478 RepID=UPI001CDA6D4A|nr:SGNH/GDSL hydrolase family protein [Limosilactobacillus mucosae]